MKRIPFRRLSEHKKRLYIPISLIFITKQIKGYVKFIKIKPINL